MPRPETPAAGPFLATNGVAVCRQSRRALDRAAGRSVESAHPRDGMTQSRAVKPSGRSPVTGLADRILAAGNRPHGRPGARGEIGGISFALGESHINIPEMAEVQDDGR